MTTTVRVDAHLSSDKEVHILIAGKLHRVLQNDETETVYTYDEQVVTVKEVLKAT
jgi:hypothetical protein